jgi:mono/diheme cytochrome c family protein
VGARFAALALVLVFAVVGCGGSSSDRLSKSAYESKVQAIGSRLAKASRVSSAGPAVRRSFAAEIRAAASELAALKPPKDAAADNQKLADGLRALAGYYEDPDLEKLLRSPAVTAAIRAASDLERKGYDLGPLLSGSATTESLASENLKKVPPWIKREKLTTKAAQQGARLFAQVGCLNCHMYLGTGGGYAGAPDLSAEGAKGKGAAWQIRHLKCPSCVTPGSPMPQFAALGNRRLTLLADFLEASKG